MLVDLPQLAERGQFVHFGRIPGREDRVRLVLRDERDVVAVDVRELPVGRVDVLEGLSRGERLELDRERRTTRPIDRDVSVGVDHRIDELVRRATEVVNDIAQHHAPKRGGSAAFQRIANASASG